MSAPCQHQMGERERQRGIEAEDRKEAEGRIEAEDER